MHDLHNAIPDPTVLLALEPEQLGAKMLFLIRARIQRDGRAINPHNCMLEILNAGDVSRGFEGYPRAERDEIAAAVSEAFAWLKGQGLLIPEPGNHGGEWLQLSRRAHRFESEQDFYRFELAKMLPRELLHHSLSESIWMAFVRSEFDVAAFHAMKQVEVAVKIAAGFAHGEHGVSMIRRAFHKDSGPLRDDSQEEAEREALMHLFAGAIGSYKNPHSHRNVPLDDPGEAMEIVLLANHLLRIVEARQAMMAGTE